MAKKRKSKKSAGKRMAASKKSSKQSKSVNLSALEKEVQRLSSLLLMIKKKSTLVRRSLAYLEREQKRVMKQINHAKRFLTRIKNRGIKAWQRFPNNAEGLYRQIKAEFNRISRKLMPQ